MIYVTVVAVCFAAITAAGEFWVLRAMVRERAAHRDEIQGLLQRIQAPDVAVVQHAQADIPEPNPMPLTEHESALRIDAELVAELERLENQVYNPLGARP